MQALRNTAEALNRYVFKRASAVPAELLKTACICCRRITMLIESWFCEQDPRGVVSTHEVPPMLAVLRTQCPCQTTQHAQH